MGRSCLEGIRSLFLRANAYGLLHPIYEDLPVPDLAGFCASDNRGDDVVGPGLGSDNFNFDFWKKIDGIFAAAIDFGMALLAPETFDFRDSHSFNANVIQAV